MLKNSARLSQRRGLGFPDIHTIEPLAEALGVSLLELLHAVLVPLVISYVVLRRRNEKDA